MAILGIRIQQPPAKKIFAGHPFRIIRPLIQKFAQCNRVGWDQHSSHFEPSKLRFVRDLQISFRDRTIKGRASVTLIDPGHDEGAFHWASSVSRNQLYRPKCIFQVRVLPGQNLDLNEANTVLSGVLGYPITAQVTPGYMGPHIIWTSQGQYSIVNDPSVHEGLARETEGYLSAVDCNVPVVIKTTN